MPDFMPTGHFKVKILSKDIKRKKLKKLANFLKPHTKGEKTTEEKFI